MTQLVTSNSKYNIKLREHVEGIKDPFSDSQHIQYDSRLIAQLTPDVDKNLPRPRG